MTTRRDQEAETVILGQEAAEAAIALVRDRFRNISEWESVNIADDEYDGFTVWGSTAVGGRNEEEGDDPQYLVTFAASGTGWRGYLTVGQHSYYWSSASEGDAILIVTEPHETLGAAIEALKSAIQSLSSWLTA